MVDATETPAPTPAGITPPPPEPTAAETSLDAHIASLTPEPVETDEAPPLPTRRHRTKDIATPADVPRIRELSSKVKAKDAEIAEWKAKYEAAVKPAPVSAEPARASAEPRAAAPVIAEAPKPVATSAFTEAEPTIEQFQDKPDPYAAWTRALSAYDRRKENFEAKQVADKERSEREAASAQTRDEQAWTAVESTYAERLKTFIQTKPDFTEKLQAAGDPHISPLMIVAIKKLENGPEVAYHLLTRPDLIAEAHLIGDGKAVTDAAVASAQRWLLSRVLTGNTGAVAATPAAKPLPHPPTPVRTGPETPSEQPPGDDAGLAAHKRFYGSSPRR